MRLISFLTLCLVSLGCGGQVLPDNTPDGRVIICLTYDDAIDSQLNVAIPQLDSLGLKATFFLNAIKGSTEKFGMGEPNVLGWKKAAQNGHELGNHTLFHPCPQAIGWQKELAIESYTLERLLKEIELTTQFLDALEGKSKLRTYAFPCNITEIGGQDYSIKLKDQKLAKYARAGSFEQTIIYDFATLDVMKVPSWLVNQGTTLDQLINYAKEVKSKGKMGVYQFHGIGSPLFSVSPTVHRQFLEYLHSNQADYWVTTFATAMEYVTQKQKR